MTPHRSPAPGPEWPNGRPSRISVSEERPDKAPNQIQRQNVAKPNVRRLQENFAGDGDAEGIFIQQRSADRSQANDTYEIDPMEPPYWQVPDLVGVE
jgi:hypothetical protein